MIHIKVNAIIVNDNQYLLLKRSPEDGGFWQTLTGTVEGDENLLVALRREVEEEAGITDLTIEGVPAHAFTWAKGDNDVVELAYLCRTRQRDVRLSHEHTDYMWVDRDKAEGVAWRRPTTKWLLERRTNARALVSQVECSRCPAAERTLRRGMSAPCGEISNPNYSSPQTSRNDL